MAYRSQSSVIFFPCYWSKNRMIDDIYSGCQKNVPIFERLFLQPLMPHIRISEHYYGKRYNDTKQDGTSE